MLHNAVGDDDVTNVELWIQSASHAGENDAVAMEPVGKQSCDQTGVDFSHPGFGQNDLLPVQVTGCERESGDLLALPATQLATQVRQLLRDGADDPDAHSRNCIDGCWVSSALRRGA